MKLPAPPLDKTFSLYLDGLRFLAAVLVVLAHYVQHGIIQVEALAWVQNTGRQAVIVFFVLSGFVIAYTTEQKRLTPAAYVIARCARVYSVALPVVVLAFVGALAAAGLFDAQVASGYQLARPWIYLPFHLLFAGELWTLSETPPWLAPYWSLGYEVWYYVFFAVVSYLKGNRRLVAGALVFAILGYKLWLLLPVWLSGVWLYQWQKKHSLPTAAARIGWVASIVLLAAYAVAGVQEHMRLLGMALWPFPALPLGSAERFLSDYLVSAMVLANFICARSARLDLVLRWARPIRALSSYTFTLYLAHGLVVSAWLAFVKPDGSLQEIALLTAGVGSVTWSLGLVTEGRKRDFQALFEQCARLPPSGRRHAPAAALAEDDPLAATTDRI